MEVEEHHGVRVLVGVPETPRAGALEWLGACTEHQVDRLLLHEDSLPEGFFELRSGVAGELLQKLRSYRVRLAVVLAGEKRGRAGEMIGEERRGRHFGAFPDRTAALAWLLRQ